MAVRAAGKSSAIGSVGASGTVDNVMVALEMPAQLRRDDVDFAAASTIRPLATYEGPREKRLRRALTQEEPTTPARKEFLSEPSPISAQKTQMKATEVSSSSTFTPGHEKPKSQPSGIQLEVVSEDKVQERWEVQGVLGKTSLSEVWLCARRESGTRRALKRIDKDAFLRMRRRRASHLDLRSEVEVLASLHHPGVVQFYESFETSLHIYLVMEFVEGGDLFHCICRDGKFEEPEARPVFQGVCFALQYLHERGIVHRDLKAENVLLTSRDRQKMQPKLADFGISRSGARSRNCRTYCGTRGYSAPEVVRLGLRRLAALARLQFALRRSTLETEIGPKEEPEQEWGYGTPSDLWSLGVLLYVLLSGVPPFDLEEDKENLYLQILQGSWGFDVDAWKTVSSAAKALVSALMVLEPALRLPISKVLEHPWLLHQGSSGPSIAQKQQLSQEVILSEAFSNNPGKTVQRVFRRPASRVQQKTRSPLP